MPEIKCPNCGFEPLGKDDNYCPRCGQPVSVRTRVDIRQEVAQNLGRVIGVQTSAINGDVYGGDIYQVQVYVLTGEARQAGGQGALAPDALPYKFLAPFEAKDAVLFHGRDAEIGQVVRQLGEGRLMVLYGMPGAGKTSLLAAGVIPRLMTMGALAFHIRDYAQPLERTLHAALTAAQDRLPLQLPAVADLPALIRAVQQGVQGTMVLVFDQFENFLRADLDPEERATRVNAVVESLKQVEPEFLRLIIAIRDDALVRLADLQEALPDLFRSFVKLEPLTYDQAETAILEPLKQVARPIYFENGLVRSALIPDLDALSADQPGRVHPAHLQIVCHQLYGKYVDRRPPTVTREAYVAEKRAEGILARYLEETLDTALVGQRTVAERLLVTMASPDAGPWVPAEQMRLQDVSMEEVQRVLEGLVGAELLARRRYDGQELYAFTSHTLVQDVRRMAGPEIEQRFKAGDELKRVWDGWLARETLPGREGLRYLAENRAYLAPAGADPPPARMLLLLRAALACGEPASPWLEQLASATGCDLIRGLEWQAPDVHLSEQTSPATVAADEASNILALQAPPTAQAAAEGPPPFGPVAWTAVVHRDPAVRQTNALAMTVPDRHQAVDRLDWALRSAPTGTLRRWRRAELRGALADADPACETLNAGLPAQDRAAIWLWRFGQCLARDRYRVLWLVVAGAVGAGLGLGLLRGAVAIPAHRNAGIQFAMYFWWAAILSAFATFGTVLASLLPGYRQGRDRASGPLGKRSVLVGIVLTALSFWLGHLLVTAFNGPNVLTLLAQPLRVLAVLVVGGALGLATYGHDRAQVRRGALRRTFAKASALRLAAVPLAFVLAEALFSLMGAGWLLAVVWDRGFYKAVLIERLSESAGSGPWPLYLALADAALAGLILAWGIAIALELVSGFLAEQRTRSASALPEEEAR